jgi:hypothetical protein
MTKLAILILSFYKKYLSPTLTRLFGGACRFTPTCSEYTIEALRKYGLTKGLVLGLKRVGRCNPWGGSGFDPVK